MAKYDVLYEPWIPVEKSDGSACELGILPLLGQAHALRSLNCESPLENFAVLRLLLAFVMDAVNPRHLRDRSNLLKAGRFDMPLFNDYVQACTQEGCSFDLFDAERPFMQAQYDASLDTTPQPAAVLFHGLNNHIHFDHTLASACVLSPTEALRALCAAYAFSTAGTQGPSSVNNTPCIYTNIAGDNLFETLVLNMLSMGECSSAGNIPWAQPPAAWREKSPVIPNEQIVKMSLLAAFTWRPRRTILIPEKDSEGNYCIRRVYHRPGLDFRGNGQWYDPHVAYLLLEKGQKTTVKPKDGRDLWRDVGTIAASSPTDQSCEQPLVLQNCSSVMQKAGISRGNKLIRLQMTALLTEKAKCINVFSDNLVVPEEIVSDPVLGMTLRNDMKVIENIAMNIFKAYRLDPDGKKKDLVELLQTDYFADMHSHVLGEYIPWLVEWKKMRDACNDAEKNTIDKEGRKHFQDLLRRGIALVCKNAVRYYGIGAKNLRLLAEAERTFKLSCYKHLKEENEGSEANA